MSRKKALLVINPRAGQNLAQLSDVLVVLEAAGWKTAIALKEYGGQTMELATKGAGKDYELVIAYGGDGTLNQVINGVMNVKKHHCTVGLIPGGTANVWASELGIPVSPVKAALTLVDSEPRQVDIGHVEVESLTFPDSNASQEGQSQHEEDKSHSKKVKASSKARHHFLLMAGLGIDAAIMGHVSKPLKYKLGPLAVGVSAASELPEQHPFPIEIRALGDGRQGDVLWKGEALQVVIGNTRRYADVVEMTPNAYIDDGVLDVCVITSGNPLTTMQQLASLLLRRKPDNLTTEFFHGSHLSISVPASIHLQLDGSAVKLNDYLRKADREGLQQKLHPEQVMVHYRFDAMPRTLPVAIPNAYNDLLFEHPAGDGAAESKEEHAENEQEQPTNNDQNPEEQHKALAQVEALLNHGREVKVVGVARNAGKKQTYIIAGTTQKKSTGEAKPVAVRIDNETTIIKRTGVPASLETTRALAEGALIVVEGKPNKRGVMRAVRVVLE